MSTTPTLPGLMELKAQSVCPSVFTIELPNLRPPRSLRNTCPKAVVPQSEPMTPFLSTSPTSLACSSCISDGADGEPGGGFSGLSVTAGSEACSKAGKNLSSNVI